MTPRFPHPKAWPFFYGWIVLAAGTLGILASVPGQTFGVSAFTEKLLAVVAIVFSFRTVDPQAQTG